MIDFPFFTQFLKISNLFTLGALAALIIVFIILTQAKKHKLSFTWRMSIALVAGLVLGLGIDIIGRNFGTGTYIQFSQGEIVSWLSLFGNGFLHLIQLLAVPVVFLSIIKVMTDVKAEALKSLTWKTVLLLLGTTAIAAVVGIVVVYAFHLQDSILASEITSQRAESMARIAARSFPEFFLDLIPSNIFAAFSSNSSIVSVVIIGALFAAAIRFLKVKKPDAVAPFVDLLDSLRVTVNSVLTNVIKVMPYGVAALVANTVVRNGLNSILGMVNFILALYAGVIIMLLVYVVLLLVAGINPLRFYQKSLNTMLFAFSSRSSVGTLPYTLDTLENELGVSGQTANFVGTLGTTIGMNGCAGVFPAMLATIVAAAVGTQMNIAFFVMIVLVVTVGSIGIAGVPGTATVAATVTLNGLGFGDAISSIGGVFGIDPIVDMGRTLLNVTGSMVSAVIVDKWNGTFDAKAFQSTSEEKVVATPKQGKVEAPKVEKAKATKSKKPTKTKKTKK